MIEFTWDARKARRNEREHGIAFDLAQAAIESGLGIEIEEQEHGDEWRTIIIAPFRGMLLIQITLAFYGRGTNEDIGVSEKAEQNWTGGDGIIRIISAREATSREQALYFAYRPQGLG